MKSDLTRAAEILEEEAQVILECESTAGIWGDEDEWARRAHVRYDEYTALANRLRKAMC